MVLHRIQIKYLLMIVLILAVFRLVPHPPNATPIAAMALFSGAMFNNRLYAYLIPIIAMFVSDLWLGFHSTVLYVYFGMAATVFIGGMLKHINVLKMSAAVLASTLIFYLLTNFGSWLHHEMYPQNLNGLVQAYVAGLPFLRNSLIANLFFTYLVFYSMQIFQTKFFAKSLNR